MKTYLKLLFTGITFFITFSTAFAQWETIRYIFDEDPLPWIKTLSFTDINNGLAGCDGIVHYQPGYPDSYVGSIIKTTDGGFNWNEVLVIDSVKFRDIININLDTAICIGHDYERINGVIARSTDGGNNWDTIMTPFPLYSISFSSDSIGYISGRDGGFLKTTDSGENWQVIDIGFDNSLIDCLFLNDTIGFISSDTTIWKTSDGGINWVSQSFTVEDGLYNSIMEISFPSFNIGYFMLSADSVYIYKTIDNGNNWFYISTLETNGLYMSDMQFPADSIGYACGQFQMYKTKDGGLTWYRQHASPPGGLNFYDDLNDVFFIDENIGFAGGGSQFYRTLDGGDSNNNINVTSNCKSNYVYPNPFNYATTFATEKLFDNACLTIFDLTGQKVVCKTNINGKKYKFFRENLPDGIYLYYLEDDDESYSGKFIISCE